MVENPAYWKRAELVIEGALDAWDRAQRAPEVIVGPSQPHHIADALRRAGILQDQDEPMIGWDGLRKHREEQEAAAHEQDE